jgi:hypothetical protein
LCWIDCLKIKSKYCKFICSDFLYKDSEDIDQIIKFYILIVVVEFFVNQKAVLSLVIVVCQCEEWVTETVNCIWIIKWYSEQFIALVFCEIKWKTRKVVISLVYHLFSKIVNSNSAPFTHQIHWAVQLYKKNKWWKFYRS